MMKIFSGECCLCDVGIPTNLVEWDGADLYTGDIVQVWYGNYIGTDVEQWLPVRRLSVVVADQYQTIGTPTGYTHKLIDPNPVPYTMGIKNAGVDWKVVRVKSYKDVVVGEHWPEYGFSYRNDWDSN